MAALSTDFYLVVLGNIDKKEVVYVITNVSFTYAMICLNKWKIFFFSYESKHSQVNELLLWEKMMKEVS